MSTSEINSRQICHDLRSLIEPLETVELLCKTNRPVQAIQLQSGVIKALKKLLSSIEGNGVEILNLGKTNE